MVEEEVEEEVAVAEFVAAELELGTEDILDDELTALVVEGNALIEGFDGKAV